MFDWGEQTAFSVIRSFFAQSFSYWFGAGFVDCAKIGYLNLMPESVDHEITQSEASKSKQIPRVRTQWTMHRKRTKTLI